MIETFEEFRVLMYSDFARQYYALDELYKCQFDLFVDVIRFALPGIEIKPGRGVGGLSQDYDFQWLGSAAELGDQHRGVGQSTTDNQKVNRKIKV